jgi:DNA-binding NtrC family response regulator
MPSQNNQPAILIVDQDKTARQNLLKALKSQKARLMEAKGAAEALELADQTYFEVVFLCWEIARSDEFLNTYLDMFADAVVIILTEQPSFQEVVKAMRLGAFNVIKKGASAVEILACLEEAHDFREIQEQDPPSTYGLSQKYDVLNIVGKSRPMQKVFKLIHKVAATDATVLILGESGTGKELVARAIHHNSPRSKETMIPVNCGAIPEELLESELFGHEKGAFTGAIKTRPGRFELAEGGTIFLDEIGDMSSMLQVKLLRVLQEHQFERIGGGKPINVDIRVLAATHRDLEEQVKQGKFREDLFYRLNVVPIRIPPLRERRSDIPLLCEHFLSRLGKQKGLEPKDMRPEVLECLMRYDWPGNVRELENLLERMVILADGPSITTEDLPPHLADHRPAPSQASQASLHTVEVPEDGLDFNAAVDAFERKLIIQALERTGGVKNQAAALLKLNRTTLVEKIKKKGLVTVGRTGTS